MTAGVEGPVDCVNCASFEPLLLFALVRAGRPEDAPKPGAVGRLGVAG